jgi:tRNA G26 N,N-dimethylase Trm1
MGGPIWDKSIHDLTFIKRLLEVARNNDNPDLPVEQREVNLGTTKRIQAILSAIIDEAVVDTDLTPLSYDLQTVQSTLKMQNLKKSELLTAFKSLGYKLS